MPWVRPEKKRKKNKKKREREREKQHGPTVQHRELHSIFHNLYGKRI